MPQETPVAAVDVSSVAKAIDFLESPEGKTALKEEKKAVKVRNSFMVVQLRCRVYLLFCPQLRHLQLECR